MLSRCLVVCLALSVPPLLSADEKTPPRTWTNSLGMKLARIAPGEFVMGQGEAPPRTRDQWLDRDDDEAPAHPVKITDGFSLGATEVTNAQFEQFDPNHKKLRGLAGTGQGDDDPVVFVSWHDAVNFCRWLAKKEGKPYRLPSEAEWEYACRAGTRTRYATGDILDASQANLGRSADRKPLAIVKVGSYKPNAWGLFDMHGNVQEWCHDWYGPYEAGRQTDPVGRADGVARVVRGWSYLPVRHVRGPARYARSANRSGHLPEDANRVTGFRIVQGELPATKPLPAVVLPTEKDVKQTPAPTKGPDPKTPYFVDYRKAGKGPTIAADAWGPIFINHNHFTAVCVCPNGDVLAAWYTTVQEPGRECAQAASRLRVGATAWEPASLFFAVPDVNAHAPVLLTHGKRIYHFFTQSLAGWDDASDCVRTSDDSGATWSKPRIMVPRHAPDSMSQPCMALVAKDGHIVVACDGNRAHIDERLIVSRDGGKTWKVGKGCMRKAVGKYAIHPAIFERRDGAIVAFLRGPQPMPVAVSKDQGQTWEVQDTPFPGIRGGMKAACLRLHSGGVLLVSVDTTKKVAGGGTFAALSLDDGKTWAHVRQVEGVGGYMALAQAPNGVIYLTGTKMGVVAFNEAWLRQGKPLR